MEPLSLTIDSVDTYQKDLNTFYIHPCRLQTLRCCQNNFFESCRIQNSPVQYLTGFNLVKVLEKLEPLAPVEVIIDQPVSVMQEYDAKQVEANAKLAGFDDIKIEQGSYTNPEGKNVNTLIVTFEKPEKKDSGSRFEANKVTTTKTTTYSKPATNTKVTSTFSSSVTMSSKGTASKPTMTTINKSMGYSKKK